MEIEVDNAIKITNDTVYSEHDILKIIDRVYSSQTEKRRNRHKLRSLHIEYPQYGQDRNTLRVYRGLLVSDAVAITITMPRPINIKREQPLLSLARAADLETEDDDYTSYVDNEVCRLVATTVAANVFGCNKRTRNIDVSDLTISFRKRLPNGHKKRAKINKLKTQIAGADINRLQLENLINDWTQEIQKLESELGIISDGSHYAQNS